MSLKKTKKKAAKKAKAAKVKPRVFSCRFIVTVEVSQKLLDDVLTDEWRSHYYNLHTPEDVAAHLAYNFMRDVPLSLLDGFADQPASAARMIGRPEDDDTTEEKIGE